MWVTELSTIPRLTTREYRGQHSGNASARIGVKIGVRVDGRWSVGERNRGGCEE